MVGGPVQPCSDCSSSYLWACLSRFSLSLSAGESRCSASPRPLSLSSLLTKSTLPGRLLGFSQPHNFLSPLLPLPSSARSSQISFDFTLCVNRFLVGAGLRPSLRWGTPLVTKVVPSCRISSAIHSLLYRPTFNCQSYHIWDSRTLSRLLETGKWTVGKTCCDSE